MNMKKKFFSILGVLALTMSMVGGIASAQTALPVEVDNEGNGKPVHIVVHCGAGNAGTGSATLSAAGGAESVAFEPFDRSNPTTVSTPLKVFRVDLDLGACPTLTWSVTASITNFTSGSDTISSSHFQLPIGEPTSSTSWTTNGSIPATNVNSPTGIVTFNDVGAASQNLATPNGSASGTMFMEFTGQMAGLTDSVADGAYEAEFTVTFNAGTP